MAKVNRVSNINNTYSVNSSNSRTDNNVEFSSYLGESQSLDKIFDNASDKYNVPVELLKSVAKAESNFNKDAVSRCGAQGIMQLMPSTAKGLGVTNSFDAEQNIMGGAKYISGLLKKYDGNTSMALAAYNAGSGNVAKYGGIPPFKETQNYVKKILGFMEKCGSDIQTNNNSTDGSTAGGTAESVLHVAPVTIPTSIQSNYSYLLTNNTGNSDSSSGDLESLFSYDDYIKFLDMFLKDMDDKEAQENTKNISSKDINYNAPVLNLMTDQL